MEQNNLTEPDNPLQAQEKKQAKRKAVRSVRTLRLFQISFGALSTGAIVATLEFRNNFLLFLLTFGSVLLVITLIKAITQKFFVRRVRRHLASALPLLEQDSFTVLLDYYIEVKQVNQEIATEVRLIEVLPTLQPSDRFLLKWHHHNTIDYILRSLNFPLIVALLEGLKQVGGRQEWNMVTQLANGLHAGAPSEAVRDTAKVCLKAMIERGREEKRGGGLLRASHSPDASQTLLREVQSSPEPNSAELLRPHTPTQPTYSTQENPHTEENTNRLTH